MDKLGVPEGCIHALAQAVSWQSRIAEASILPGESHVGFVVDTAALGHVSLE
jgi:hypothetical protein